MGLSRDVYGNIAGGCFPPTSLEHFETKLKHELECHREHKKTAKLSCVSTVDSNKQRIKNKKTSTIVLNSRGWQLE